MFTSVFGWVKRQDVADTCRFFEDGMGVAQGDLELSHDRVLRDSESSASLAHRLSIVQCLSEASQEASM